MNPLLKWYKEFELKRKKVVEKYNLKTPEEIVEFFRYTNISAKEPDFCPLFKEGAICHPMEKEELICFFCGCPYYDYPLWDEENKIFGGCKINSKFGKKNEYGYWDCSACLLPHREKFVLSFLKKKNLV